MCQSAAVVAAVLTVSLLHRGNDGLWFQGDAPRHAINGFFIWDWLRAFPADPLTYAVRYYARYPVISPATYPPLFYIVEGFFFQILGPSPLVARSLIAACAAAAGLYTMAWARRWIAPAWGWAGAILVLMPGMIVWSNAVMLNVPAVALSTAALYHTRRASEDRERREVGLALGFLLASLLTYYQSAATVLVVFLWFLMARRRGAYGWRQIAIASGVVLAIGLVPLVIAIAVAPVQLARHLPTVDRLASLTTWTFYPAALPQLTGSAELAVALLGLAVAGYDARWRRELAYLATWIGGYVVSLSLLPARDARYVLPVLPAFAIAIVLAPAALAAWMRTINDRWRSVLVAGAAVGAVAWAFNAVAATSVPRVSGFREPAVFLRDEAPADAVMYDGFYDGVFGFYFRGLDPRFERRLARGGSLLYYYGQTRTFRWVELPRVHSADEVVAAIRERCGCRWVAVEAPKLPRELTSTQRLLREAIDGPAFEKVRSFPIDSPRSLRIDLYRVRGPVAPVSTFDLTFPSFSDRVFRDVSPVSR